MTVVNTSHPYEPLPCSSTVCVPFRVSDRTHKINVSCSLLRAVLYYETSPRVRYLLALVVSEPSVSSYLPSVLPPFPLTPSHHLHFHRNTTNRQVRKAIEAIKAKSAAGGGGAKLSAKPGLAAAGVGAGGRQQVPPGSATAAAPGNGTAARAAPSAPGGSASSPASAAAAAATAGRSPGAKAGAAGAGGGGGDAGAKAVTAAGLPASATQPSQKTGKSGKKKNRKKK